MTLPDSPPGGDGSDDTEAAGVPEQTTWSRVVIFGAATLAVLLIGATIGMLLTVARDDPPPVPVAGSVEVGFAQDMSVHHVQAVTMSNWARDHSGDPAIVQLAFDIGSTQLEQVGRMKGWLMLWHQPEEPIGEYMRWMSVPGGHAHGADPQQASAGVPMPGMATNEELSELRSRSGTELDVYFLQLMLRHHQGGTDMAQFAYDHSSAQAVRALASSMLKSQGAEMELMRRMLAERGAQPLPFP